MFDREGQETTQHQIKDPALGEEELPRSGQVRSGQNESSFIAGNLSKWSLHTQNKGQHTIG